MKPNIFIVGAAKCGTTAWVEYLNAHPGVYFPPIKEPHHFAPDIPGRTRARTRAEYLDLFRDCSDATVVGEASVHYINSKLAAQEIFEFNPDAKILIFLRDQEDFLPSFHAQLMYTREETIEDFAAAWALSGKRGPDTIPPSCQEPSLLNYEAMGRFHEQVERYFAVFPADQIRVLHFRDWVDNPREAYVRILEFLGLEDDGRMEFPKINEARYHRSRLLALLSGPAPSWILRAASIAKKVTGLKLHWQERLQELNRAPGYRTRVDPALRKEIRDHYEADNALLEPRLWKLGGRSQTMKNARPE